MRRLTLAQPFHDPRRDCPERSKYLWHFVTRPTNGVCVIVISFVTHLTPNSGLGAGSGFIATTLYIAECSPTQLRGSFVGTVTQFGYQLGTLIAFWTGYGMVSYKTPDNIAWRIANIIQIPIGLLFVAISLMYPESPVSKPTT
jgi:MFS family permease